MSKNKKGLLLPFRPRDGKANKALKIYYVGRDLKHPNWHAGLQIERWLKMRGHVTCNIPKEADVFVFAGGPDIHPSIYGQKPHLKTRNVDAERDFFEKNMAVLGRNKLKVGICRGAQLLNALSGGSMIQHISHYRHIGAHSVRLTSTGEILPDVPSTHHQMMLPSGEVKSRDILATAYNPKTGKDTMCLSSSEKNTPVSMEVNRVPFFRKYTTSDFKPLMQDAEIVYCKNTFSLCIQGHPERAIHKEYEKYCIGLIESYAAALPVRTKELIKD